MSLTDRKTVLNSGRPERLTSVACRVATVRIYAERSNTGRVFIGHTARVCAEDGKEAGEPICPAQFLDLTGVDLHDLWIDAVVDGDGVTWRATPYP